MVATASPAKRVGKSRAANATPEETIVQIAVERISPSPYQPREYFDEAKLAEMAQSIKYKGRLVKPIVVRLRGKNRYELVCGERGLRATKLAGLPTVSSIVRDLSNEEAAEEASIENLHHEDLRPPEEGKAITNLLDLGLDLAMISERTGKSMDYLQERLNVLELPDDVQQMISEDKINLSHAKVLGELSTKKDQREAAKMAHNQHLTATQLKARTQHKRGPSRPHNVTQQAYGHQQLSKDILSLHANLQALQIDPELPDQKRETLSKQIGVLVKALEKAQSNIVGKKRSGK
ncbi:MAG: ParB/RepB/Spo0J family partition protein [Candidatus Andersenbacteria bacterium]